MFIKVISLIILSFKNNYNLNKNMGYQIMEL